MSLPIVTVTFAGFLVLNMINTRYSASLTDALNAVDTRERS